MKWNEFFLKTKQFTICSKNPLQKTPAHFIWNENGYIFPTISKKLKNICPHLLWSENEKIFPEN